MIRLRTLGTIDLKDGAGHELESILSQPKRLGLLVYLALARPRGYQRRDTLLALFWPELDERHGRGALRQSLYTLRQHLPSGTLRSRGGAEVGITEGSILCDVHELERALEDGRPADAVELYRGELLPAFHVPDTAPELDYWITGERERVRQLALTAAVEAAQAAEASGDARSAVKLAARAVKIDPLNEASVRREMRLRHRAGDPAGALLAYETWAQRLADELELEPSEETRTMAEQLRTGSLDPSAAGEDEHEGAEPTGASREGVPTAGMGAAAGARAASVESGSAAPPPQGDGPVRTRRWSRGWVWAAVGFPVLVALSIVLLWPPFGLTRASETGPVEAATERLLVLPFSYSGTGESAYLSDGLVHLFSVAMDGDDLRSVDPNAMVRRAAQLDREEIGPAVGAELAAGVQADVFLLGTVVEAENTLQLTAYLYDREGGRPLAWAAASGGAGDVLQLVDRLAADLLTSRAGSEASTAIRLAGVTTASLPALKAYLNGERYLREGRFVDAIGSFEAAVLQDTLFALAHYRMSLAASWAFRGDLATEAAERAVRHSDRLPEQQRRLLAAHEAYRRGHAGEALRRFRALSDMYPEDPEVWYRLGEVIIHFGPLHGWSIQDAREPFRRALALEPFYTRAGYHLVQIEAASGDSAAALRATREALEATPDGARSPQLRAVESLLTGGRDWTARLEDLRTANDFTVVSATYNVGVYLGQPDRARDVARILTEADRNSDARAFGHALLADLELALGRVEAARGQLQALSRLDPAAAEEHRAFLGTAPVAGILEDGASDLFTALAGSEVGGSVGGFMWPAPAALRALERPYLRGLLAARLREPDEVEAALADLAAAASRGGAADTIGELSKAAGELARDIRFARAAEMERIDDELPPPPVAATTAEISIISAVFSRPGRRYLQARWLETRDRHREALRWYESLAEHSVHDLPWAVPGLLDRARIHEMLGDEDEAVRLYQRFIEYRRNADDPTGRTLAVDRLTRLDAAVPGRTVAPDG